jgi:hypothetical protein
MLVSHRKQFIFTKTRKAAGTSVESYFEPYCMPDGEWEEYHARPEYVSETGIIGLRAFDVSDATWYNHLPAQTIRDQLGHDVWDRYFKFTTIRNPFDRLVSRFFHREKAKEHHSRRRRWTAFGNRLLGIGSPEDRVRGKTDVSRFRSWIRNGGYRVTDREVYLIDGDVCVDTFIRYEDLHAGIAHVCEQVGVPFEPELLLNFKSGMRNQTTPVREYYDPRTRGIVEEHYAWELEHFGYDMPE